MNLSTQNNYNPNFGLTPLPSYNKVRGELIDIAIDEGLHTPEELIREALLVNKGVKTGGEHKIVDLLGTDYVLRYSKFMPKRVASASTKNKSLSPLHDEFNKYIAKIGDILLLKKVGGALIQDSTKQNNLNLLSKIEQESFNVLYDDVEKAFLNNYRRDYIGNNLFVENGVFENIDFMTIGFRKKSNRRFYVWQTFGDSMQSFKVEGIIYKNREKSAIIYKRLLKASVNQIGKNPIKYYHSAKQKSNVFYNMNVLTVKDYERYDFLSNIKSCFAPPKRTPLIQKIDNLNINIVKLQNSFIEMKLSLSELNQEKAKLQKEVDELFS